jgi:2-amino-4-hydroxy-6-hydroxymethyldihydropteridine pyrophosphokinase
VSRREVVYLALGSNLGDRARRLAEARTALAALPETALTGESSVEETAPLGAADQPPYLNQMVRLETGLEPRALMRACQAIERAAGRERRERWASRTLDLDIVLFGERTISEPDLVIPHPGLAHRDFWQRELAELKADDR